jgi:hypothetical protein
MPRLKEFIDKSEKNDSVFELNRNCNKEDND